MVWRRLLEGDAVGQAKMSSESVQIGDLAWWDIPWIQRPLIGVETLIMLPSGADVSLLLTNRAAGIGRWNEHRPQVRARSVCSRSMRWCRSGKEISPTEIPTIRTLPCSQRKVPQCGTLSCLLMKRLEAPRTKRPKANVTKQDVAGMLALS